MSEHECHMQEIIEKIRDDVSDIKKLLTGDKYHPEGFVHKMNFLMSESITDKVKINNLEIGRKKNEEKIEILESFKEVTARKLWILNGAAIVAMYLIQIMINYWLKRSGL